MRASQHIGETAVDGGWCVSVRFAQETPHNADYPASARSTGDSGAATTEYDAFIDAIIETAPKTARQTA
jgi:hypothetical protein